MAIPYFAPGWFFGYDVALEAIFALILLAVVIFAYKVYKTTSQKSVQIFGIGITFMTAGYIIQSIFNFLTIYELKSHLPLIAKAGHYLVYQFFGTYAYVLLMNIGLILVLYMTLKIKDYKVLVLMSIISLIAILSSQSPFSLFAIFSTIYLLFISAYFIKNYLKNRNNKTLSVAVAFVFLLLANMHFIFSLDYPVVYVIGHILELVAYGLILFNFYLVRRHDKKKRKA